MQDRKKRISYQIYIFKANGITTLTKHVDAKHEKIRKKFE
jgi:hypothetical protein